MSFKISRELNNLKIVRSVLNNAAIVCFLLQLTFDFSKVNFISCLFALAAFLLINYAVFNIKNRSIVNAFSASIFFFIITANSFAPLLGTLLEGHSLRSNLEYPIETFFHRFIFSLVLVISLSLTNSRLNSSSSSLNNFSEKIKINRLYPPKVIWLIGLISVFIFLFKGVGLPTPIVKFLDGFGIFLYSPFILLLPPYSSIAKSKKVSWFLLYYILMVVLALVTNSRMGMIGPILFVGLAFLMVFLTGRIEINHKIFSKFFFIALIGFFAVGVMSDISTAILIERAYRNNRNTTEKLLETVNTFNDKEKLRQDRNDRVTRNKEISDGNWSEDYISNPFLGRFVQVKFDDNCLSRIYDFRPAAKNKLTEITIDKILVTLPSPIIKIVGLNVDKLYLNSFSMGDMIDVLSGRGFLGGFKTGSIIANSYCVFGWWYPFFFIILYSSIIKICQYLISRTSNLTRHKSISTLSFILPYYLFTSISLDNISSIVAVLLRGIWQLILIYFVALSLSNKIQKILFSRQHKMNL